MDGFLTKKYCPSILSTYFTFSCLISLAKFIWECFVKYLGLLGSHLGKSVLYFLYSDDLQIFASTYLNEMYLLQGLFNVMIRAGYDSIKLAP